MRRRDRRLYLSEGVYVISDIDRHSSKFTAAGLTGFPLAIHRRARSRPARVNYDRNQQYSIVGLTNAAGTLVERYTYSAYGTLGMYAANRTVRTSSTYANRYTHTGREGDAELNLYHFRARWYDPATGAFISRDPLGYVDGMSLYRGYFGVREMDPNGHFWIQLDDAKPPVFGNTFDTLGVLDPGKQYPNARTIVNIWGLGEATGTPDYYVPSCPKAGEFIEEKNKDGKVIKRLPTTDLADRSVDIILLRSSPLRCCELGEICRICKDGCLVIISFADYPSSGPGNAEALFPSDEAGMWDLFTECLGVRFTSAHKKRYTATKIVSGTRVDIDYWGWYFSLGPGECPRHEEPKIEGANESKPDQCL